MTWFSSRSQTCGAKPSPAKVVTPVRRKSWNVQGAIGAAPARSGAEVMIHPLWVELGDRAGEGSELDVRAAAALAGMACGLRFTWDRATWAGHHLVTSAASSLP